jgi:hypothetical protein
MISLVEFFMIASFGTLTAAGASHGYHLLRQPRGNRAAAPSPSVQDGASDRPSAGAWHTPRQTSRHRVGYRMDYGTGMHCSIGKLVDISRQGWRVVGEQPVVKGTKLSVTMNLPGETMPIMIDEAMVRWTNGNEFGIELTRITPDAAARLSDYLTAHLPASEPVPVAALSPFSYN